MLKKILIIAACVVGAVVLTIGGYVGVQAIHYTVAAEEFDISAQPLPAEDVVVFDCNVRCFSTDDNFNKSWFRRAELIMQLIADACPDIITFQEVTKIQLDYFKKYLVSYDCVSMFRDDSLGSEASPIFYRADRFDLTASESFWLSETPNEMSKGWGAHYYRICSCAVLREKATNKPLAVFNTHLDHQFVEARVNGIDLVLDKIAERGGIVSILTGDMNDFEGSETYLKATASFFDSRYVAEQTVTGDLRTYHGYGKQLTTPQTPIDFCFVSKTGIDVEEYKVLNDVFESRYYSDHYAVVVTLKLT